MRKTLFFVVSLMIMKLSFAQVPLGIKHDVNGMPLNGYHDPMTYSPKKRLLNIHNLDSYETGYYYDASGNKVEGLIKFKNSKIFFKEEKGEARTKITPGEVNHFVIGVDSFMVIKDYYFKNRIRHEPVFVQYITEFDGYRFAKHYHFKSGFSQGAGAIPVIETYLVRGEQNVAWDNFPDNKNFQKKALIYFGHIPHLKEKLSSDDFDPKDMLSVIKMAEYYQKYDNEEPIWYDKYWQEVRKEKDAEYKANIRSRSHSQWTFDYYKDSLKLYQANYSSFFPHEKNGPFTSYYPNGQKRQVISYDDNKPKRVSNYNQSGVLIDDYLIIEHTNDYNEKVDVDIKYIAVNDSLGNNILNSKGKSTIDRTDELTGNIYTSVFEGDQLKTCYRMNGKDSIFQIVNPDYKFKIKPLETKFEFYLPQCNLNQAIRDNAQGTILVSLLIDWQGYVVETTVLNHIHPEIDEFVESFLEKSLSKNAEFRLKFKPFKRYKQKRFCEVVLPIEFGIDRFYRPAVNYYHFNHSNWFFQNQMMNQHRMMNNFKPPKMPTVGF